MEIIFYSLITFSIPINKIILVFYKFIYEKNTFLSFFVLGCGGEIYYLDSYNYSKSGESLYETKQLESSEFKEASIEAYEFIADEIISVYSRALALDENLGGVDNEINALEFLNLAMFNYEIYTVNRERMK